MEPSRTNPGKLVAIAAMGVAFASAVRAQEPRLLRSTACLDVGRSQPWGRELTPLHPSPGGILKDVAPYSAFGADGYEVRIYGDPMRPSGVVIGIFGNLAEDLDAKKRCLAYLAELLLSPADRAALRSVSLDGGRKDVGGMRLQVSPPQSLHDGWWIAAFDPVTVHPIAAPGEVPGWIEGSGAGDRGYYAPDPLAREAGCP